MTGILDLLRQAPLNIRAIAEYFDDLTARAVAKVNADFMANRMFKSPTSVEPLPLDARHLADYRTRIGMMLEYAASTEMHRILQAETGGALFLTFVWYNTYPDFVVRDAAANSLLRMEMKAVDALSDEQAAKFGTLLDDIWTDRDMLVLFGWHIDDLVKDGKPYGQVPHVFSSLVVPAVDLAEERDRRLIITGGEIRKGQVLVPGRAGKLVPDPGNFGKFKRLVHPSRRTDPALTAPVKRYLAFVEDVLGKARHLNGS